MLRGPGDTRYLLVLSAYEQTDSKSIALLPWFTFADMHYAGLLPKFARALAPAIRERLLGMIGRSLRYGTLSVSGSCRLQFVRLSVGRSLDQLNSSQLF